MRQPNWLPKPTRRDEALRAGHGLTLKKDGCHKWLDGRVTYIAKPMKLAEVVAILDERISAIRAKRAGTPVTVSSASLTLEGLGEL